MTTCPDMPAQDYLGIPYKHHGRDRNGLDCYGLPKLMYEEVLEIEVADEWYEQEWYRDPEEDQRILDGAPNRGFVRISDDPADWQAWDVLFFNTPAKGNKVDHMGLCYKDRKMIHCHVNSSVTIERLSHFEAVFHSAWRHQELIS